MTRFTSFGMGFAVTLVLGLALMIVLASPLSCRVGKRAGARQSAVAGRPS